MHRKLLLVFTLVALTQVPSTGAGKGVTDWHMWGGSPDRNMGSGMKGLPIDWDIKTKKNIKWVAELGSQSYGNPVVASSILLAGRCYLARGEYEKACEYFNTCLELRMNTLPADHWLIAATKSLLGECHVYMGNTADGQRLLWENYELLRERLGPEHERTVLAKERIENAYAFMHSQG